MAHCQRCNKYMLFSTKTGCCKDCDILNAEEERKRKAEEEKRRKEEEERRAEEEKRRIEERKRKADEEKRRKEEEDRIRKAKEDEKRRPDMVFSFIDNSNSDIFAEWLLCDDHAKNDRSYEFQCYILFPIQSMVEDEILKGTGLSSEQLHSIDWKNHVRNSTKVRAKSMVIAPPFIVVPRN